MNKPTAQKVIEFAGLTQSETVVSQWIDDVALLAADCLEPLNSDQQEAAIRYLVAGVLSTGTQQGAGRYKSESLGDASWSYELKDAGQSEYGRMALRIAPCLGSIMGVKQYGAVRLIR